MMGLMRQVSSEPIRHMAIGNEIAEHPSKQGIHEKQSEFKNELKKSLLGNQPTGHGTRIASQSQKRTPAMSSKSINDIDDSSKGSRLLMGNASWGNGFGSIVNDEVSEVPHYQEPQLKESIPKQKESAPVSFSLPKKAVSIPGMKLNDPGLSSVRDYIHADNETIENKDASMIQYIAQNLKDEKHHLSSNQGKDGSYYLEINPKVYASLMQKASGFVADVRGLMDISSKLPLQLVQKFDDVASMMKLNREEKQLFGKAIATSFMGAVNQQDGLERLITLLDMREVADMAKGYKLYSQTPDRVAVEAASTGKAWSSNQASDLKARDNIARLAVKKTSDKTSYLPKRDAQRDVSKMDHPSQSSVENDLSVHSGEEFKMTEMARKSSDVEPLRMAQEPRVNVADIAKVLSARMNLVARKDGGEMKLKLYPESLGELFVKVQAKNDDVQLRIIADNSETKNLLEAQLTQLRENMSSQNLNLSKVEIDVNAGHSGRDFSQHAFSSREQFGNGSYESSSQSSRYQHRAFSGEERSHLEGNRLATSINRYGNRFNFVA